MAFEDLRESIAVLNIHSDNQYHAYQVARNKKSSHYNDRKIVIYFENKGFYKNKNRLIPLIEFDEHKFGSMNSRSKYMGYEHVEIFDLITQYVTQRRSVRAPLTNSNWSIAVKMEGHTHGN